MQPNQYMTWKYLAESPRRIKVAELESYPRDEAKRRHLIDTIIANHPEVYMHQDDIQSEIQARHKELEDDPGKKDPDNYFNEP